jgi:hypothetical protein
MIYHGVLLIYNVGGWSGVLMAKDWPLMKGSGTYWPVDVEFDHGVQGSNVRILVFCAMWQNFRHIAQNARLARVLPT